MGSQVEGGGVPAGSKGSWSSFLKSISSFRGDLASLTAPPFILSTTSLTEYSSYWAEHPSLFVAPADESDPEKRAVLVLKWFLSTLKQQYSSRSDKLGSEKKPLNPFLGELFLGEWKGDEKAGVTKLVSEQVSHHPPVTAYSIWNEKHGVRLQGYNAQKASISLPTLHIKQVGHALLHIDKYNEDYLITLPSLHIEGLVYGTPYVELNGSTYIVSSSGYTSKIDYTGKGWLSGKKNTCSATLYKTGDEKHPLHKVSGHWNESFSIYSNDNAKVPTHSFVAAENPTAKLVVPDLDKQDPLESRRAWHSVAEAIQKGDMDKAGEEKTKIENSQRELRAKEKGGGTEWPRRYFSRANPEDKDIFVKLAKAIGQVSESDKTDGIWRWDQKKADAVTKASS